MGGRKLEGMHWGPRDSSWEESRPLPGWGGATPFLAELQLFQLMEERQAFGEDAVEERPLD